ncbi:hypothetical protein DY000_02008276 [Brassica cretica]|uniref:Uncharacterized protein n=1 Tax=Brassica cretica TaxID=69181 RepID=A0ABQ7BSR1_BRACR|nr:hypothetical protein DY000_02008276 [Brassica cretica]
MEGSSYRKLSFSQGRGRSQGLDPDLPLIARFHHRRGITCALKSTGVAHSPQASLRQDIAPVILQSRVSLRPEPHSEPGGGLVPLFHTGVWRYKTADFLPKVEKL